MPTHILLIEKEPLLRSFWEKMLRQEGFDVFSVTTEREAIKQAQKDFPDFVFLGASLTGERRIAVLRKIKEIGDSFLVIVPTNPESIRQELLEAQITSCVLINFSISIDQFTFSIKNAIETQSLMQEVLRLQQRLEERYDFSNIIGQSQKMQEVFSLMKKAIESETTTILIQGESGTGKELVARAIHYQSSKKNRPFIELSCAAIPENLLESELFGYEQGAFTDAKKSKRGLLENADGGTLFLDEIGDMPLSMQAKLLKVLEDKQFRRLGGTRNINVDIRIIAATNKDLRETVSKGAFRGDLYYRLSVFPIHLPPLREREGDILPLVKHYIEHCSKELKKKVTGISTTAAALLNDYDWPGNVRELKNVIERAIILTNSDSILPEHLPSEIQEKTSKPSLIKRDTIAEEQSFDEMLTMEMLAGGLPLEQLEKSLIKKALQIADGNQTQAAKLLHLTRFTLRYRMKKYGLLE
jgi:DNA-binding NtrC family response regulator